MGLFGDIVHGVEHSVESVLHLGHDESDPTDDGASDPSVRSVASGVASETAEQVQSTIGTGLDRAMDRGMEELTDNLNSVLPTETTDFVHGALGSIRDRVEDTVPFAPTQPTPASAGDPPAAPPQPVATPPQPVAGAPQEVSTHVYTPWTGSIPHPEAHAQPPTWCLAGTRLDDPDATRRATNRGLYTAHVLRGSETDPCLTLYCRNASPGECQYIHSPDNPRLRPTCEDVVSQVLAHLPSQSHGEPTGYTREAAVAAVCAPPPHTVDDCRPGGTLSQSICHLTSTFCAIDEECRSRVTGAPSDSASPPTGPNTLPPGSTLAPSDTVDRAAIDAIVAGAVHVDHPHHLRDILHNAAVLAKKTVGCTLHHLPHALTTGGLPVIGTDAIGCLNDAIQGGDE